jgi:hypothetical protein
MEAPQIQQTTDYSIFKSVNFNREKNKRHIQNLKQILMKENLLHLHPILVNEKMEVVDGQHRLEAAKELSIPIFYIKSELSYDHILNSNLFQKKLSLEDVIKFYAKKDQLEPYIQLYDYLKMLDIKPKCFFGLIFGGISREIIDFIKSGKFNFPSDMNTVEKLINSYMSFIQFVKSKRITPHSMFTTADFSIGYRNLVLSQSFNEIVFLNKIEQRWFDLKPQLNSKEWTRQMIGIYNWKNHNPLSQNDGT